MLFFIKYFKLVHAPTWKIPHYMKGFLFIWTRHKVNGIFNFLRYLRLPNALQGTSFWKRWFLMKYLKLVHAPSWKIPHYMKGIVFMCTRQEAFVTFNNFPLSTLYGTIFFSRADWIFLSASLGDERLVQIALSSGNWKSDRSGTSPRASSKVFIMTLNKMGLRTPPWGQPFSRSWMSDVSFPTLTCIFLPFKKLRIQWNIFTFIPKSLNFMSVSVVHIRSKAFSRSRVTAAWHLFSIKAIFISDSRRTSWSIVDLCFL